LGWFKGERVLRNKRGEEDETWSFLYKRIGRNGGTYNRSDALPSPGVNPLEGSTMCNCGKLGFGRCS
jgi:hypothetical protein